VKSIETSTFLSRGFSVDDDNYFYWALVCNLWSLHWSLRVLTSVTRWCSASLTICFSIFKPYKTLQHVLLLVLDVVSTSRPLEATSLAASATACWIQSGSFGKQGAEWPVCTIWPAYLYCRPTTTSIVQRGHVWGSKNLHESSRSFIYRCRAASVEQPTSPSTWICDSEHTLLEFCQLLKTHLFHWGQRCLVTVAFWAPYKFACTFNYITFDRVERSCCALSSALGAICN